jgi:hypothetical protein
MSSFFILSAANAELPANRSERDIRLEAMVILFMVNSFGGN